MTLESIARAFLQNELSVDSFVTSYFRAWRDNTVKKGNLSDEAAGSIFTCCDAYDEEAPKNTTSYPICEDELRLQVEMCLNGQTKELYERMKKIKV